MTEPKILYYPVWISTHAGRRKSARCWGPPCDTIRQAKDLGRAEVDAGNASIAFVVEFRDGKKTPVSRVVYPGPAKTVIGHWEDLWDITDEDMDAERKER